MIDFQRPRKSEVQTSKDNAQLKAMLKASYSIAFSVNQSMDKIRRVDFADHRYDA